MKNLYICLLILSSLLFPLLLFSFSLCLYKYTALFQRGRDNLMGILLCQALKMNFKTQCGIVFDGIFSMKPNVNFPCFFSGFEIGSRMAQDGADGALPENRDWRTVSPPFWAL